MVSVREARGALVGRLLVGHFACYPMMLAASVFAMSLSIVLQRDALVALSNRADLALETYSQRWLVERVGLSVADAVSFELIMRPVMWLLLVIFVVTHAASLPWALAARRAALDEAAKPALARATRMFLIAVGVTTGSVMVAGTVGWVIIFAS